MARDYNNKSVPQPMLLPLPPKHSTLTFPLPSMKRKEDQPREVEVPAEKMEAVSTGSEGHPRRSQSSLQAQDCILPILPMTITSQLVLFKAGTHVPWKTPLGSVARVPHPTHTTMDTAMGESVLSTEPASLGPAPQTGGQVHSGL